MGDRWGVRVNSGGLIGVMFGRYDAAAQHRTQHGGSSCSESSGRAVIGSVKASRPGGWRICAVPQCLKGLGGAPSLALRRDHGQFARIGTNYDGLLISVLTEAQAERDGGGRRTAGPCPLRGMRTASVAHGEGARLAAAVSLVLASAKVRDHVADGDGLLARRPVALAARRVAAGWGRAGARTGSDVGFDTAVLVDAVDRQLGIETLAGPGTSVLTVTEPTETATAAAFAHTAVLAGRPGQRRAARRGRAPLRTARASPGRGGGQGGRYRGGRLEPPHRDRDLPHRGPAARRRRPARDTARAAGGRLGVRGLPGNPGSPRESTALTASWRTGCSCTSCAAPSTVPSARSRVRTWRARTPRPAVPAVPAAHGCRRSHRAATGVGCSPAAPSGWDWPVRARCAAASTRTPGRASAGKVCAATATAPTAAIAVTAARTAPTAVTAAATAEWETTAHPTPRVRGALTGGVGGRRGVGRTRVRPRIRGTAGVPGH